MLNRVFKGQVEILILFICTNHSQLHHLKAIDLAFLSIVHVDGAIKIIYGNDTKYWDKKKKMW